MARTLHVAAFFLFLTKLSIGQRNVTIQKGPLYRVEGYLASISCSVSGYQGTSQQDFQWFIYLPIAPTQEIQIISTNDANFPYAVYAQRVLNKDIYVERVQDNSVIFHISKVQIKDSGEYECHTPNTDLQYYGVYSAKTNLTVIPDTLSATMSPQTLRKEEGEPLDLTCEVAKATALHTHLSVAWYLVQGEGNQAIKIISLSKDFLLTPGPLHTGRFATGGVRLDNPGATTFRLSIRDLKPIDQGQIFCEATEWIQDPDKTWTCIAKKQTNKTTLWVQPEVRDFQVEITAESTFATGKPLELTCLVVGSGQNPLFQGVWFFNDTEVAGIDAGGVLGLKEDYKDRASQGQLQVSKLSPKAFSLKIFSAGPEDEGTYRCVVVEVTRAQKGPWEVVQRKQSPDWKVRLTMPAARNVVLSTKDQEQVVWEGEAITFLCKADGEEWPLSVSWWHAPQDQTQPEFVAGMGRDGTLQLGASSGSLRPRGNTRLEKIDWGTFQMELTSTTIADSGIYECRVSETTRNQATDLSWTQKILITVKSLESSVQVNVLSRQPRVKLTNTLDLSCIVSTVDSSLRVLLTVTWQFQLQGSPVFHQLVQISHNGTITWGDLSTHFQKKTRLSQSSRRSQLLIHDITEAEGKVYRCQVDVYTRNSLYTNSPVRLSATSQPLRIVVILPESKLKVNSKSQVQEISISSNVDIACHILSQSPGNVQLAVIWEFSYVSAQSASWLRILELDQKNVAKYGDGAHTPQGIQKFHTDKVSEELFQLHILNVGDSDQGQYRCSVQEWLLSMDENSYKLGEETSGLTELILRPTGSMVRVSTVHWPENVTEHQGVVFLCGLESAGSATSLFSVIWFRHTKASGSKLLVHLQYDGLLEYGDEKFRAHMHCYRSSPVDFVLKLPRVEMEDAGTYWCKVAEWQLHGTPGDWVSRASDESKRMILTVLPAEESTFVSRVCSSPPLLYFMVVGPFMMFIFLLTAVIFVYWKARELADLSQNTEKEELSAHN